MYLLFFNPSGLPFRRAVPGACSFHLLTAAFPNPGSAAASGSAVSLIAPGGAPAEPEIR